MRKVWWVVTVVGFVLMTGALIYSRTTPPEPGGVVGSSLILTGAVITFVGSIGRWLSASDKDDR